MAIAMKHVLMMGVALLLHASCKDNSPSFHLPDNLYEINKAYDIGNNGNAADLRFELKFLSTGNVSDVLEVRLVIVKGSKTFTLDQIDGLKPGNFLPITPSSAAKQVVKSVSGDLKDADGATIGNGDYKAYLAVLGKENSRQLSEVKPFTLEDKPIYAGDYIGTWEDLGPPGPAKTIMSLRITPDYKGEMFYASNKFMPFGTGNQDAVITMTVNGATIASFVVNQAVGGYKGGCIATQTLTGRFVDDVNLVLDNFNWPDCDGTRDVALQFFKQ